MRWLALAIAVGLLGCPSSHPTPGGDDDLGPPDAAPPFAPPRGATWDPDGRAVHFRLAAPRATRIELWIYAEALGAPERLRVELARDPSAGGDWVARVPATALAGAIYYGYRVWGPSWTYDPAWRPGSDAGFVARVTADGDRMNPNKLLIDPYAKELSHDPITPGSLDGSVYRTDEAHRALDSGPAAAKGIILAAADAADPAVDVGPRPQRALADDVVYEVHLRGLTAGDAALPCRGTYAGALARVDELVALGVTAVEFLPVQETQNDANDVVPDSAAGDNYWGYSTLGFFAPDRRYACDRSPGGPTREWRAMVRGFHARGVKVWIDVVYNHTAEGGGGSLLSWRGLDNAGYYQLNAAGTGFTDHTGVGASVNARDPLVRDLVIDSLAYWARELGVDGFRFDLAPILANGCDRGCFRFAPDEPGNALVRAAAELPARPAAGGAGVDLIAEPWAIGAGTYQVGRFPAGWAEWNDQFRDLVRRDLHGLGEVTPGWLADRIAGSPELFADDGRPPAASINHVVSHDGFTLADLHGCAAKANAQPWPYGPSNGGNDRNLSSDHGGDRARQRQAARTSLALVALAAGVPMIVGGDEVLRSQRCNNNPYNLDSPAIWLDPAAAAREAGFLTYTQRLFAFRHAHPALRPRRWHDGATVAWFGADGRALTGAALDDPAIPVLAWRLAGGGGEPARSIYVAHNGGGADAAVTLPAPAAGAAWYRVADTGAWMEPAQNFHAPGTEYRMNGVRYDLAARSLALWIER